MHLIPYPSQSYTLSSRTNHDRNLNLPISMPAPTHQDREVEYCSREKRIGFVVDKRPVANNGLASVGQTVHIEIFVIFAIGSGLLTGKVL